MKPFKKHVLVMALTASFLGAAGAASAAVFLPGENVAFFRNNEVAFRPSINPLTGLLEYNWHSPGGGPALPGDLFIGTFDVQNIKLATAASDHWNKASIFTPQYMSGVFVTEIATVYGPSAGTADPYDPLNAKDHLVFKPYTGAVTTFNHPGVDYIWGTADDQALSLSGKIGSGAGNTEMFAFYLQNAIGGTDFSTSSSLQTDWNRATDGALYFTLGMSLGADGTVETADDTGYAYSHAPLGAPFENFAGDAFYAMDDILNNVGMPFYKVLNDPTENEVELCDPLGYLPCGYKNVAYANAEFTNHPDSIWGNAFVGGYGGGNSSIWDYESNDPLHIYVPEPATLALLGIGLVGMGFLGRRRTPV